MHTVIVGGGFAGVKAAMELGRRGVGKVTLVSDDSNFIHHAILPMVAVGLPSQQARFPIKDLLRGYKNVKFINDTLVGVDIEDNIVTFKKRRLEYDNLILALGSVQNYFGVIGVEKYSYCINTLEGATAFYDQLTKKLSNDYAKDSSIVIVGGGVSGVEMASALQKYISQAASRNKPSVRLVERSNRILPVNSESASQTVLRRLQKIGVEVGLNESVISCDKNNLTTTLASYENTLTIWTAGVQINPFFRSNDQLFRLSSRGRVEVSPYLEAAKDIYVLGDNAEVSDAGSAKSAINMGKFIARYLDKKYNKITLPVYRPKRYLTTISVGDHWSYIELYGIFTTGRLAKWIRKRYEMTKFKAILPHFDPIHVWRRVNGS